MKRIILIIFLIAVVSGLVCAEGIDENTVLMLHMDDTGLSDGSDSSHSVTLNGDAALNTGTYQFSPGSAYFDGDGDYLSIPDSEDWNFGTEDFTIDFWIYHANSVKQEAILTQMLYSGSGSVADTSISIVTNTNGNNPGTFYILWKLETQPEWVYVFPVGFYPLSQWVHVALVRNGTNLYLFANGIRYTVTTGLGTIALTDSTAPIEIGRINGAQYFTGYIDELRISKGVARWTSDFTPPIAPYSAPAPFATCGDTVPYEGQSYNTVLIGEQCWFAENLNVGTKVTGVTEQTNNALIEKYCYNDDDAICTTDGGLYQWDEMMQYVATAGAQGICPDGWHVPTDAEWIILEEYLGMCSGTDTGCSGATGWRGTTEGDELKKSGLDPDICYGSTPPCGSSGFDSLLVGYRKFDDGLFSPPSYAYFWSSLESGTSSWLHALYSGFAMVYRNPLYKTFGFPVRCLYDGAPTTPTTSNFTSDETTNFSAVADITNVTNLTLAKTGKGKIKFPESTEINAEAQDYDTNIVIEDEFISVNTAALDSTFNTSATITLEGVTCPVATITYQEGTFTSKDDIIAGGSNCELDGVCSNIQCSNSTLTFDVAHFTGFAAGADANLTIQAEIGTFYPLDPIEFTAEYINSTDGTPISGECNISFDDDWDTEYTMDFNTPDYNYTKSFVTSGLHENTM